jgi:hypothetical protein
MTMMPTRPATWEKVICPDTETCYWIAPDGTRHECTAGENAEVRRELLEMRVRSDKIRQEKLAERS